MDLQSVSSPEQLKLTKSRQSNLIISLSTILTVREIHQFLNVLQRATTNLCLENALLENAVMEIEKVTKDITKVLDEDEKLWVKGRNILPEEKLKRDAEKANHHMFYFHSCSKMLVHGGPFISAEEVDQCLKGIKDEIEKKFMLCQDFISSSYIR